MEVFSANYRPYTYDEWRNFWMKQAWFYAVLYKVIKYHTGRDIVLEHHHDSNAQMILV